MTAIVVIIGLSGGLAVGTGYVAFLSVLGILPRLVQLSKTNFFIRGYEVAIIIGSMTGCFVSFTTVHFHVGKVIVLFIGSLCGVFIGLLAAALTEVLNVLPILAKRIYADHAVLWFLSALALGKMTGSLFQWLYFIWK